MLSSVVQPVVSRLSESSDIALIFVSTFVIAYVYYRNYVQPVKQQSCQHPPSLRSLPVVGSVPYIPGFKQMHKFFLEKLPTMGSVIRFTLMSRNVVMLQTREAIAEAFSKAEVSNRPSKLFFETYFKRPKKGIINMTYAAEFKKYHQLTLTILKQFGFGKLGGVMEARIHGEVSAVIADFKASMSQSIDPADTIDVSVMNVIASILFGKRYDKNDPQVHELLDHNSLMIRTASKTLPLSMIPVLRFLPYYKQAIEDSKENLHWFKETLTQKIDECIRDETETPCFIRSFIEAEGSQSYDKDQLNRTLHDLVLAGSETSATTIRWSVFLLANYPEIQTRLQTEVDSVVPRQRLPSLDDKPQLPFVEAYIMELMRFKTIAPIGVAHETSKDTVIQGFFIPASTMVIPNLYAVHMDPTVWVDPQVFRPDRFIDREKNIINREKVIPFSVGKRSCLGELLARQELFLFITGLLQNFTVLPPDGCSTVDCEEIIAATVAPSPYKVRFVPR